MTDAEFSPAEASQPDVVPSSRPTSAECGSPPIKAAVARGPGGLFLAAELPENARLPIAEACRSVECLRPYRAESYHVTLAFLGRLGPAQRYFVERFDSWRELWPESVEVKLGDVYVWQSRLRVEIRSRQLQKLQARLLLRLAMGIGHTHKQRDCRLHITLGRVPPVGECWVPPLPPDPIRMEAVSLCESVAQHQFDAGPQYSRIKTQILTR